MSVPIYYNTKESDAGLPKHLKIVCAQIFLSCLLLNFPGSMLKCSSNSIKTVETDLTQGYYKQRIFPYFFFFFRRPWSWGHAKDLHYCMFVTRITTCSPDWNYSETINISTLWNDENNLIKETVQMQEYGLSKRPFFLSLH